MSTNLPSARFPRTRESGIQVSIDSGVLGFILHCARSYDRRMPSGIIPSGLFEKLPLEWKNVINELQTSNTDAVGAETRGNR